MSNGDGNLHFLQTPQKPLDFLSGGIEELLCGDDLANGQAFDESGSGVVMIGVRMRDHDGIDHAVATVPETPGDCIGGPFSAVHSARIKEDDAPGRFDNDRVAMSHAEYCAGESWMFGNAAGSG